MDTRPILTTLADKSHINSEQSLELQQKATSIVESIEHEESFNISQLPDFFRQLLTDIIQPLFSKSQHPQLTSTGRKNLVSSNAPSTNRVDISSLFDEKQAPWKNGWCVPLLEYVISKYSDTDDTTRKKTIEAHFHLLVPPILHQIDDIDISYKASGCRCLREMADVLQSVRSDILKRTGLTDVFIDALKTNFLLLPTLTPEDESLMLLRELYPAFRSLVRARFVMLETHDVKNQTSEEITSATGKTSSMKLSNFQKSDLSSKEQQIRRSYLTLLLRHQLLHSLSHLSTGVGAGGTISLPLSSFLVSQISWILSDMGISAVWHLQELIPLLRNIMTDPFGSASPDLLLSAINAMAMAIQTSWPRIKDLWWSECLRGIVGCWINITDDEPDTKEETRKQHGIEIKKRLKLLTMLLEDTCGDEMKDAKEKLLREEQSLRSLFES